MLPLPNDASVKQLRHRYNINISHPRRGNWAKAVKVEAHLLIQARGWNITVDALLGITDISEPVQESKPAEVKLVMATQSELESDSCRYCGADIDYADLQKRKSLKMSDKFCSPGCKSSHQRSKR